MGGIGKSLFRTNSMQNSREIENDMPNIQEYDDTTSNHSDKGMLISKSLLSPNKLNKAGHQKHKSISSLGRTGLKNVRKLRGIQSSFGIQSSTSSITSGACSNASFKTANANKLKRRQNLDFASGIKDNQSTRCQQKAEINLQECDKMTAKFEVDSQAKQQQLKNVYVEASFAQVVD